jgi:hypothetical protein
MKSRTSERVGPPCPRLPAGFSRIGAAGSAVLLAALLAACTTQPPAPESALTPSSRASADQPKQQFSYSSKPAKIPTRPLNVSADCSFKDPTGYRGSMKLEVAKSEVRRFEASVIIPEHGSCRFDLKGFRQSGTMPHVVLNAAGSGCEVRMWEQGRRVTVAFSRCEEMCSPGAYVYLWPILADARRGTCG